MMLGPNGQCNKYILAVLGMVLGHVLLKHCVFNSTLKCCIAEAV